MVRNHSLHSLLSRMARHADDGEGLAVTMDGRSDQVAVEPRDEFQRDLLGADGLAFGVIGAGSELLARHGGYHVQRSRVALGLALRQHVEVFDLRGGEEHGGSIWASRDAGAAANAGGGVHRGVGRFLGDEDRPRVRGLPVAR